MIKIKFPTWGTKLIEVGDCIAVVNADASIKKKPKYITRIKHKGKKWNVGRLSFSLNCLPISRTPENMINDLILTECDHKWCISPAHLYRGTAKDRWAKYGMSKKRRPALGDNPIRFKSMKDKSS